MSKKLTVLCIGAHTADAVDLAGGTLYKHVKRGDRVIIVNMTHGAYSHAGLLYDEYKAKGLSEDEIYRDAIIEKNAEADRAAAALGVTEVINLSYDDEPLEMSRDRILALAELIRETKPDFVLSHHPNEYTHEDHAVCGTMVIKALKAATKFYPGSKFEKHHVPAVYFFGIQFLSKQARLGFLTLPYDLLVDIEEAIEAKIQAFTKLRSQKNTEKVARERVNSLEREYGRLDGVAFSEAFISYYPMKAQHLVENSDASWYELQNKIM